MNLYIYPNTQKIHRNAFSCIIYIFFNTKTPFILIPYKSRDNHIIRRFYFGKKSKTQQRHYVQYKIRLLRIFHIFTRSTFHILISKTVFFPPNFFPPPAWCNPILEHPFEEKIFSASSNIDFMRSVMDYLKYIPESRFSSNFHRYLFILCNTKWLFTKKVRSYRQWRHFILLRVYSNVNSNENDCAFRSIYLVLYENAFGLLKLYWVDVFDDCYYTILGFTKKLLFSFSGEVVHTKMR